MTAESRGWGPPPTPRDRIVPVEGGEERATFPGGVHRDIAPLVERLVERLEQVTGELAVPGHCWGYAPRKIRGSSTRWSNHAWGLAIDFNAPAHALHARGTFGDRADAVREVAGDLMFRWGGDYTRRADEMHFEFMGTPEDARRLVEELPGTTTKAGEDPMERRTPEQIAETIASWRPGSWRSRVWKEMEGRGVVNEHTDPIDIPEMIQVLAIADRIGDHYERRIEQLEGRLAELERSSNGPDAPEPLEINDPIRLD